MVTANSTLSKRNVLLLAGGAAAVGITAMAPALAGPGDDSEVDRAIAGYRVKQVEYEAARREVEKIDATRPEALREAPEREATSADDFVAQRETFETWSARSNAATKRHQEAMAKQQAAAIEWEERSGFSAAIDVQDVIGEQLAVCEAALYTCRVSTWPGLLKKLVMLDELTAKDPAHVEVNLADPDFACAREHEFLIRDVRRLIAASVS